MGLAHDLKEAAPFAAMVLVECGEVGMTTLTKAAMNNGMSNFVYIVYYNALGTLILLPSFIFHTHRNKQKPPLTLALFCRFFLLGLLGKSLVMFGYVGIDYSSPTLAAALGNLTPVFTFLLAVLFRMENVNMRSSGSIAKSLGTVISVSGALVVTLYKGPALMSDSDSSASSLPHQGQLLPNSSNWVLGGLFLAIGYLFGASWSIAQAATVREHPDKTTVIFYYVLFGTIQCTIVSLIIERNTSVWILLPGIEMIAVVYSAIFGTAIRYSIITWCLHERGPLYVALFKPLGMVIAMIGGLIFLGDILHLGSVIGATTIAIGFYTVMWGQAREKDGVVENIYGLDSSTQSTPLLQNPDTKDV